MITFPQNLVLCLPFLLLGVVAFYARLEWKRKPLKCIARNKQKSRLKELAKKEREIKANTVKTATSRSYSGGTQLRSHSARSRNDEHDLLLLSAIHTNAQSNADGYGLGEPSHRTCDSNNWSAPSSHSHSSHSSDSSCSRSSSSDSGGSFGGGGSSDSW